MKTYPVCPGLTVTSYASYSSHSPCSSQRTLRERRQSTARRSSRATHTGLTIRAREVDNRRTAPILRRALMDLVTAFQTLEREVHSTSDRGATSTRC